MAGGRQVRLTLILVWLAILAMTVAKYNGLADQYLLMDTYFNDPQIFPGDIYLSNSFFPQSSIFFPLNKLLRVEQSEFRTFVTYLFTVAISVFAAYRIFTRYFRVDDAVAYSLLILMMFFVDRRFPNSVWTGMVPLEPGTQTMFAHGLSFVVLYLMLQRRLFWSALVMTLTLAFNLKVYFLLVPIFGLYVLFAAEIDKRNLAALVIPLGYVGFKALTATVSVPSSYDDRLMLYQATSLDDRQDADYWFDPWTSRLLLIVAFAVFAVLMRRVKDAQLRALMSAVLISSVALFVCAAVYTGWLYRLYPYPPLMALGLVRAQEFFFFFFYGLAFTLILQAQSLRPLEKAASIVALALLHAQSIGGFAYPIVVLAVGFGTSRFALLAERLRRIEVAQVVVALLAVLVVLQMARGGIYQQLWDANSFKYLNRTVRTVAADDQTWAGYAGLRDKVTAPLMLAYYETPSGRPKTSEYFNLVARKTPFISGGFHFYFAPRLYEEHLHRKTLMDAIGSALSGDAPLDEEQLGEMRSYHLAIGVTERLADRLPAPADRVQSGKIVALMY